MDTSRRAPLLEGSQASSLVNTHADGNNIATAARRPSLTNVSADDGKRYSHKGKVLSSGVGRTTINIAKAFMGAASFELPWAFDQAGLLGGVAGIIAFAFLTNACFSRLAALSTECGLDRPSYPQIARHLLGRKGELAVWCAMFLMTVGVVGSYLLFVGELVSDLAASAHLPQWACTLLTIPVAALLSLPRTTRLLSNTSLLGLIAIAVACAFVIFDALHQLTGPLPPPSSYPQFKVSTYPLFLGNAAYLFLISTAILPMEQNMHPRTRHKFRRAFTLAQVLVTLPNVAFAVVVYMAYCDPATAAAHDCVRGNVVRNLGGGTVGTVVRVFTAANQLLTVPLFLVPMADAFERRLLDTSKFGRDSRTETYRNICRLCLTCASAGAALLVPQFAVLTGLTGALGNNLLAFVLVPVLCIALVRRQRALSSSPSSSSSAAVFEATSANLDMATPTAVETTASLQAVGVSAILEHSVLATLLAFGLALLTLSTWSTINTIVHPKSNATLT
jgi:amino acid permease